MTILDGDVTEGWIRERKLLKALFPNLSDSQEKIQRMALNYAKKISNFTGLSLEEVMNSEPFKSYVRKLQE